MASRSWERIAATMVIQLATAMSSERQKSTVSRRSLRRVMIVTAPAPLEFGVINYRNAIRKVLEYGFNSPFLCEHYGGDGLSISATNRAYLRRILPRERHG